MALILFTVKPEIARALRVENTPPRGRKGVENLQAAFKQLGAKPQLSQPHMAKRNERQPGYGAMSVQARDAAHVRQIVEMLLPRQDVIEVTAEESQLLDVVLPKGCSQKLRFM